MIIDDLLSFLSNERCKFYRAQKEDEDDDKDKEKEDEDEEKEKKGL